MTIIFSSKRLKSVHSKALEDARISNNGNSYRVDLSVQMSTKDYAAFKPLIHSLGIFWNGSYHESFKDPSDQIQLLLEQGRYPKTNPYSLIETPQAAIDDLLLIADFPEASDFPFTILEPESGKGAIARELRARYPNATIDCCEIDPVNQEILRGQGFDVLGEDFLSADLTQRYDLIAMNPPFEGFNWVQHILKAHAALKRNGTLAAIVPESIARDCNHNGAMSLQRLIGKCGYVEQNSTRFEGTKVNTLLLQLRGWSLSDEQRYFQPYEGLSSVALYYLMQSISSDGNLHAQLQHTKTIGLAKTRIVECIYRFMEESNTFLYWDDQILEQAAILMLEGRADTASHPQFSGLPLFECQASSAA